MPNQSLSLIYIYLLFFFFFLLFWRTFIINHNWVLFFIYCILTRSCSWVKRLKTLSLIMQFIYSPFCYMYEVYVSFSKQKKNARKSGRVRERKIVRRKQENVLNEKRKGLWKEWEEEKKRARKNKRWTGKKNFFKILTRLKVRLKSRLKTFT